MTNTERSRKRREALRKVGKVGKKAGVEPEGRKAGRKGTGRVEAPVVSEKPERAGRLVPVVREPLKTSELLRLMREERHEALQRRTLQRGG